MGTLEPIAVYLEYTLERVPKVLNSYYRRAFHG